jgi:hypothetical protein
MWVLNGLAQVPRLTIFRGIEVGDRSRQLQDPVMGAPLPVRKSKPAISHARLHSLAALFYRVAREANHIEIGHLGRADMDLHLYAVRADPVNGSTVSFEEHRLGRTLHSRTCLRRRQQHQLVGNYSLGLTYGKQTIDRPRRGWPLSMLRPSDRDRPAHQAPRLVKLRHFYLK